MGTNGVELSARPKAWSQEERRAILDQLARLLASPHFIHSKRYPTLLRYVVEQALAGRADQIKERVLGIEVFGRAADYDTTQDPVVRTTAGEIRKRIAQYYHEPGHEGELRIELPSGTYVPEFEITVERPVVPPPVVPLVVAPVVAPVVPETPPAPARAGFRPAWWPLAAGALVLAGLALAVWAKPSAPSALDRFWGPVLDSPNPALLCVGQPHFVNFQGVVVPVIAGNQLDDNPISPESQVSLDELYLRGKHYISLWDSITVSRLAAFLEARSKRYRIRGEISTSLEDLRDGPAILVGGFNNDWTLRLTGQLRFSFVTAQQHIYAIHDRQNQSPDAWVVNTTIPYLKQSDDYALISRIRDATTDRVVVVAAGVAFWGTIAAGEFLTDPKYMEEVARNAPSGWERKNMQIVIGTKVIAGNSGPPRVLATYFW